MSNFFKKNGVEKSTVNKTTRTGESLTHSSSYTFSHEQKTTVTEKRLTLLKSTTGAQVTLLDRSRISHLLDDSEESKASTSSLNACKPDYKTSISYDASPFDRNRLYKSTPPRSAFTSPPLTVNLNYKSPYRNQVGTSSSTTITPSYVACSLKTESVRYDDLKQKLNVKVIKSIKFHDDSSKVPSYRTRSKKRGKLLLINNIQFVTEQKIRKGSELDEKHLEQVFKQIGFEVIKSRNLNKKNMEKKITDFKNDRSLNKVDIGAVIIMSHGTGNERSDSTEVVCSDGELLPATWIINQFTSSSCRNLSGKPKIFIFQCCRGDDTQHNIQHDGKPIITPRDLSDILVAYSTIPGFVSHRDPQNGTWYIQAICKVFMEHAHDTDVENLLKIVDHTLSSLGLQMNSRQTSSFENRGFKTCYLHPQLYESGR